MDIVLIVGLATIFFVTLVFGCLKSSDIEERELEKELQARKKKDQENEK